MSTNRRLVLIRAVISLALLATFMIAPRLFLRQPFLGPIPVADWIPEFGSPWDWLVLIGLAFALIPVGFSRRPRRWIFLFCGLLALRCVWDRITWQPFLLQYACMLMVLAWVDGAKEFRDAKQKLALNLLRLILICIYLWSGISKFNYSNMVIEPQSLVPLLVAEPLVPLLSSTWWLIPIVETLFALALLVPRLRSVAMATAIGMHVMILLLYGPVGLNYNAIVWPWNVAMICLAWLVFHGDRQTSAIDIVRSVAPVGSVAFARAPETSRQTSAASNNGGAASRELVLLRVGLILFFGLGPALSYVGAWSPFLSYRLYSHQYHRGDILLRQSVIDQLPDTIRKLVRPTGDSIADGRLSLSEWGEHRMNAFPPADRPVIEHMAKQFATLSQRTGDVRLLLHLPPNVMTGETQQQLIALDVVDNRAARR